MSATCASGSTAACYNTIGNCVFHPCAVGGRCVYANVDTFSNLLGPTNVRCINPLTPCAMGVCGSLNATNAPDGVGRPFGCYGLIDFPFTINAFTVPVATVYSTTLQPYLSSTTPCTLPPTLVGNPCVAASCSGIGALCGHSRTPPSDACDPYSSCLSASTYACSPVGVIPRTFTQAQINQSLIVPLVYVDPAGPVPLARCQVINSENLDATFTPCTLLSMGSVLPDPPLPAGHSTDCYRDSGDLVCVNVFEDTPARQNQPYDDENDIPVPVQCGNATMKVGACERVPWPIGTGCGAAASQSNTCMEYGCDGHGSCILYPRWPGVACNTHTAVVDDSVCRTGICGSGSFSGVCVSSPTNEGGPCDDDDPCSTGDRCVIGSCLPTIPAPAGCIPCVSGADCQCIRSFAVSCIVDPGKSIGRCSSTCPTPHPFPATTLFYTAGLPPLQPFETWFPGDTGFGSVCVAGDACVVPGAAVCISCAVCGIAPPRQIYTYIDLIVYTPNTPNTTNSTNSTNSTISITLGPGEGGICTPTNTNCTLGPPDPRVTTLAPGTPCAMANPNTCDQARTCLVVNVISGETSCIKVPAIVLAPCDDGNPCTFDDVCLVDGTCNPGIRVECNLVKDCLELPVCLRSGIDAGTCSFGVRPPLSACTNPCLENPKCTVVGNCAGVRRDCDDLNPCTLDACDEWTNRNNPLAEPDAKWPVLAGPLPLSLSAGVEPYCRHSPSEFSDFALSPFTNGGDLCDDGDLCTTVDTCACSGTCTPGLGTVCDESARACETLVGCSNTSGTCLYLPIQDGGVCNDTLPCTVNDTCSGGICTGVKKDCNSGQSFDFSSCVGSIPACHAETGECYVLTPQDGGPCDDSNPCTSFDTCQNGTCGGVAQECPDPPNDCYVYTIPGTCMSLDAAGNAICSYTPHAAGTNCNDFLFCTSDDVCDGVGNCAGIIATCNDPSDPCTLPGVCDPVYGKCTPTAVPNDPPTVCGGGMGICFDGECEKDCTPECTGGRVCVDKVLNQCSCIFFIERANNVTNECEFILTPLFSFFGSLAVLYLTALCIGSCACATCMRVLVFLQSPRTVTRMRHVGVLKKKRE